MNSVTRNKKRVKTSYTEKVMCTLPGELSSMRKWLLKTFLEILSRNSNICYMYPYICFLLNVIALFPKNVFGNYFNKLFQLIWVRLYLDSSLAYFVKLDQGCPNFSTKGCLICGSIQLIKSPLESVDLGLQKTAKTSGVDPAFL